MNLPSAPASREVFAPTVWERWASLLGRLLILFAVAYCPLIFFTWTWRHYHVPKTASFQYLILLLVACWAIVAVRWRSVRSATATPAAFFFMIVMATTLWAANLAESWETISFLAASMVFMVLVPKFFTKHKDFYFTAYLLGVVCFFVDLYALAQWFNWQGGASDPEYFGFLQKLTNKPVSFMGNENYTAEFLNMTLPICFAMMLCFRRKPAQLLFYSIITLMNCIVMVYIDCNASFAGFLAAIPFAIIVLAYFKAIPFIVRIGLFNLSRYDLERRFRKLLVFFTLGLSVLAAAGSVIPNRVLTKMAAMASWMDIDGDLIPDGVAPVVFRLQCMDAAARNVKDAPLTGIGPGNFKVEHPLYESQLERKVLGEETLARKVHNDHLTFAVEHGVLGSFGWYWIIAAVFFAIFCSFRLLEYQSLAAGVKGHKTDFYRGIIFPPHVRDFYFYLQWGVMTGLIVALVSCAFGHTFVIVSGAIVFWFLCGVAAAVYQRTYFASQEISNNILGVTHEPVNGVQAVTRRIPGFAWWAIAFLSVIPLGALNLHQLMGETWLRQGMTERAEKNYYGTFLCFQKAMRLFPYQMETFYILGRYYIDAIVDIESVGLSRNAENAIKLPAGLKYEDRRRLNEEGIVILQTDLFMNPNYKWAHNNLGVLYDRYFDLIKPGADGVGSIFGVQPNPEQAVSVMNASSLTYQRVLAIDKEQVYAHFNLGLSAIKAKDYASAIEELNEALITDPSRYDIYKYLSNCYNQSRMFRRAYRAAEKYLEKSILLQAKASLEGSQNLANYQQILQYLRDNDYGKAVAMARLLFQFNDADAYNLFIGIASDLIQEKENPEEELTAKTVEMAEKILANPSPENYLWHAKVYEKIKKYDKAAHALEDYLRIKPNDPDMLHSLMLIYVEMNDLPRAYKAMSNLVEVQPDNWKNLVTYSRLMAGVNIPWETIFPVVQKAIQLGGDEAREALTENQPGNLILPSIKKDPRMRDLLGPAFFPADASAAQPASATAVEPEAVPDGAAQTAPSSQTQPAEAASPLSADQSQSATQ